MILIEPFGPLWFHPDDDAIFFPQSSALMEVRSAQLVQTSDERDSALMQKLRLEPGTEVAISQEQVAVC